MTSQGLPFCLRGRVLAAVAAMFLVPACSGSPAGSVRPAPPAAGGAALTAGPRLLTPAETASPLTGTARTSVTEMLGPADFVRRDGPAEILQYQDRACVLDVFLYQQPTDGQFRVIHLEARDANLQNVASSDCLARVKQSRSGRSG